MFWKGTEMNTTIDQKVRKELKEDIAEIKILVYYKKSGSFDGIVLNMPDEKTFYGTSRIKIWKFLRTFWYK